MPVTMRENNWLPFMFTFFFEREINHKSFESYDPHLKVCLVFWNIALSFAGTRSSSPVSLAPADKIVLHTWTIEFIVQQYMAKTKMVVDILFHLNGTNNELLCICSEGDEVHRENHFCPVKLSLRILPTNCRCKSYLNSLQNTHWNN